MCVVQVFDGFEEPYHGVCLRAFELGVGGGDLCNFGVLGCDLGSLQGFGDGFEVLGIGEDSQFSPSSLRSSAPASRTISVNLSSLAADLAMVMTPFFVNIQETS